MERTATCSCGRLSVTCVGDPVRVAVCHCLACQKQTGSAFNVAGFFRCDSVTQSGEDQSYSRPSDAGYDVSLHFCPRCGSTLWWQSARAPDLAAVAVGAFADPLFPAPDREVWMESRHPWVTLSPGVKAL